MSNKDAMTVMTTAVTNLKNVVTAVLAYIEALKQDDVSGNLTEMASQIEAITAQFQAILPQ